MLTTAGVLHTDDGGASWWGVALPGLAGGGVRPESFFATSGAAWVATVSPGAGVVSVFRVDGDGSTITGALPDRVSKGAEVTLSVLDSQGGYAAVGDGRASDLYRTTDGGRHWASTRVVPVFRGTSDVCSGGDPSVAYSRRDHVF